MYARFFRLESQGVRMSKFIRQARTRANGVANTPELGFCTPIESIRKSAALSRPAEGK